MYRARKHEVILARWSPDYTDPHSNVDAFARNPDNRPEAKLIGVLAWRNSWQHEEMNAMVEAARNEPDLATREQRYHDIQRSLQENRPTWSCSSRPSRWCGGATSRGSCPDRISISCSTGT